MSHVDLGYFREGGLRSHVDLGTIGLTGLRSQDDMGQNPRWYTALLPCPQISGRKCGFKSLSQLLEDGVKMRFVHRFLKLHVQASLQTVV